MSNIKNIFFLLLFVFSLFFVNTTFAAIDYYTYISGCGESQASCSDGTNQICDCGSGTPLITDLGTMQCAGPHGQDAISCWAGESCTCEVPSSIPGCTDPGATNYNPNATYDDGSCEIPPVPPGPDCGNGTLNPGEQCDLGTANNGSCPGGCSNSCTLINCNPPGPSCGDGEIDPGEACDTGVNNGGCPRTCSNSCTVNSCGSTTVRLTFTATGPGKANGYRSATNAPPYTFLGSCRNSTCIVPLPRNTYVSIQAIHDTLGGDFDWQPLCPADGSDDICRGLLNVNSTAGVTFNAPTVPVNNNVSISATNVEANSTTQYQITVTSSDSGGGGKINIQHALINHQGSSAGQYRGWLAWGNNASSWWSSHKDLTACTGGGGAVIQSVAPNNVYGHDYIELDSCSTTVVAGTRTTVFVVRFNTNFTSPVSNNDISLYTSNTDNNTDGWDNYDINFGLITTPTNPVVTISPLIIVANGSASHQITVTGTDERGGNNISPQEVIINGASAESLRRGWLMWGLSGASWWPGEKDLTACTGGGHAAVNLLNGSNYIELVSCSTTVVGNNRTTTFNVQFNDIFNGSGPYLNNDITGRIHNLFGKLTSWVNSDLNFGLDYAQFISQTVPTTMNTGQTYSIPITMRNVGGSTWTQAGNYKLGSQNPQDNTTWGTSRVLLAPADSITNGNTKTFTVNVTAPSTPGTYNFRWRMVREGVQWFGQTTPNVSVNVVQAPAVPVVNNPIATNITETGATLGATVVSLGFPASISARGTCWGTTNTPPLPNCSPASGVTTGAYSHVRSGMSAGTTYYYQGYATNSTGTGYSPVSSFTTGTIGTYLLTVAANPGPGGRITGPGIDCGGDCSETVTAGANVTLNAIPASSYWKFNGWGGACSGFGTNRTCNLTVNSDTNATASFTPRAFIYREF